MTHPEEKKQNYQCLSFIIRNSVNPFPDNKILDWSKMEQNADNILKCI